jgi:hypothetical protein
MVAHYRPGLPVGYSARRMAAGLVRAAIDAGTTASRFPAVSRAASPASSKIPGITVTGTTPRDEAKLVHAQRPAANPGGTPTRQAITSVTLACQTMTSRT